MANDIQKEFFRRFLACHGAEVPFIFIGEVNDIKSCKEVKIKNMKISHIQKKYFKDAATG